MKDGQKYEITAEVEGVKWIVFGQFSKGDEEDNTKHSLNLLTVKIDESNIDFIHLLDSDLLDSIEAKALENIIELYS